MNPVRLAYTSTSILLFSHPAPPPPPPVLDVREVAWEEVPSLAKHYPEYFGTDHCGILGRRWGRGGHLYEFRAGDCLHFAWLIRRELISPAETPGCSLSFRAPIGEIGHCWTPPDCRGRGLYPAALQWLADYAHNRRMEPWVYCLSTNTPSMRGIMRAGFQLRATFRAATILAGALKRRSITLHL